MATMSEFDAGAGFSASFLNHFILTASVSVVCLVATLIIVGLISELHELTPAQKFWTATGMFLLLETVVILIGFFINFWR